MDPVIPELYHAYKNCGNEVISSPCYGDIGNLRLDEKELIDEVYDVYGQYSASKLRNLTHSEPTWQEAENKEDTTITVESMKEFFPHLMEN